MLIWIVVEKGEVECIGCVETVKGSYVLQSCALGSVSLFGENHSSLTVARVSKCI